MSEYDLRSVFPFNGREFATPEGSWVCHLAEVSDLRPEGADRLSFYLVFERGQGWHSPDRGVRKLELVTPAESVIQDGFPAEAEEWIANWVATDQQDGRIEWPTAENSPTLH